VNCKPSFLPQRRIELFDLLLRGEKSAFFLTLGHDAAEKFSVKVNVVGVADPDPSIKDKIDAIERKRADQAKCVRYSSCSFYVFIVLHWCRRSSCSSKWPPSGKA
jgi:hypothetical protein